MLYVLGTAAPLAGATEAPVSSRVTTNYYVFGGTNHAQIRAAMKEARPWKQSMVYDANTEWDVKSHYRYSQTQGEWKLSSILVSTKVAITLPRWIPGRPVSPALAADWQKCFTGLIVHEQGHLQLALAAGAEVRRRLTELPSFASAQELTAAANHAHQDAIEEFRQREVKYDEVTGHGRTQGAVFQRRVTPEERVSSSGSGTNGFRRGPRGRLP